MNKTPPLLLKMDENFFGNEKFSEIYTSLSLSLSKFSIFRYILVEYKTDINKLTK